MAWQRSYALSLSPTPGLLLRERYATRVTALPHDLAALERSKTETALDLEGNSSRSRVAATTGKFRSPKRKRSVAATKGPVDAEESCLQWGHY